ncbi:MAG TPA: LacI family DNA-binding transcriptional regulator [Candidatus Angelobacter sp.]|nr:LacI family DNA-binding transcriptional regulator [Candidatus Angelobacter sp.]
MKDIADGLGLSVVTVSKVLRGHPDIGEDTREKVLQRVRELNYQPNILARSLVTGRSFLVGLIVPDLIHPFFAEIAKALATAIRAKGYSLIVSSSEEDHDLEQREIRQLLARQLDALVIASTRKSMPELVEEQQERIFVLIDRDIPGAHAHFIGIDDKVAGRLATEHLIAVGCRRIAHIRGRETSTAEQRFAGYREALQAHGLEFDENLVISRTKVDTDSTEQGAQATKVLLKQDPRPDGIFCFNDPLAVGAMREIEAAGLRIPEDIALIGCGNLHYDDSLRVPLSSIDQHSSRLGQQAGELVLSLLESKQRPLPRSHILQPELIVRESTSRPSADGV